MRRHFTENLRGVVDLPGTKYVPGIPGPGAYGITTTRDQFIPMRHHHRIAGGVFAAGNRGKKPSVSWLLLRHSYI